MRAKKTNKKDKHLTCPYAKIATMNKLICRFSTIKMKND